MNRPDQDSPAPDASGDTTPAPTEDEHVGGHVGNPANLESGAPVVEDLDDGQPPPTS